MIFYKDYLKERSGLEVLETPHGFATYKFRNPDCYIQDIYIEPMFRKSHLCFEIADKISNLAKNKGYKLLTGSVDSRANGSEISEKVLLAYGMKPYTTEGSVTYYVKELI